MCGRAMAATGAWMVLASCAIGADGGTENAVEALRAGRAAFGATNHSVVTYARKGCRWEIVEAIVGSGAGGRPIGDADLNRIANAVSLEKLSLASACDFTETGMGSLAKLEGLHYLVLPRAAPWRLGEAAGRAVGQLTALWSLDLGLCDSEPDLARLQSLPRLKEMRVILSPPGERSGRAIQGILKRTALQELEVEFGDDYEDYGRPLWVGIRRLKDLRLLGVARADAGAVSEMKKLPRLERLNVGQVVIGDGNLDLSGMARLRSLRVDGVIQEGDGNVVLPGTLTELSAEARVLRKIGVNGMPESLETLEVLVADEPDVPDLRRYCRQAKHLSGLVLQLADNQLLAQVPGIRGLRELTVGSSCCSGVGAPGLAAVSQCVELESLRLNTSLFAKSKDLCPIVTRLKALRRLELPETEDAPEWMAELQHLTHLRALVVTSYRPEARSYVPLIAASVRRLGQVEELTMCSTDIDGLCDAIAALKSLTHLSLRGGGLSDEGLMKLSRLRALRVLDLSDCTGFTDKGLASVISGSGVVQKVTVMYRGTGN